MGAVWMRVRAELRARWRSWLAFAIAFGIAGGAATAAAAGARRTETAYPRFVERQEAYHIVVGGLGSDDPEEIRQQQRALAGLPQVEAYGVGQFVSDRFRLSSGLVITFPEALILGDATGNDLLKVNRAKILDGRMFDPDAADEAIVDFITAERLGIGVGDSVDALLFDPRTFEQTVVRTVEIVGVGIAPGGLPAVGQTPLTGIMVSPAFLRAHAEYIPPHEEAPSVRLRDAALADEFIEAARAIAPNVDIPVTLPRHLAGVQKTLRFDVAALWILAALIAGAALVILGQALARQVTLESGDNEALRALGMGRGHLITAHMLRALGIGVLAAMITVAVAIAASPLTPRGLARVVETDVGVYADWPVLLLGAAGALVCALLVSIVPAARLLRRRRDEALRASTVASALGSAGAGPSLVAGARLALEPGRGARGVPVRATIAGVAVALAAFTAAGSFTESLNALIGRPELYGFTWDIFGGSEDQERDAEYLANDPDVEATTLGGYTNMVIAGRQLIPFTYVPGTIEPTILEGRAPVEDDEIALGSTLLSDLNMRIGDEVIALPAEGRPGEGKPFTIVGRTVVPPVFFQQVEPGESSAMTLEGALRLSPSELGQEEGLPHIVRYRPGTDLRAKVNDLREALPNFFLGQIREPGAELSALSRSSGLPVLLTTVLLLMAIATLVHALGSSIRKRRHDLAILKTLGFVRGQVRATVAWQATTLIVIALAIGIPLGIAAGRWSWRWFADTLGVVPDPTSPLLIVTVLVPISAILLANVIAAVPARAAARTQAAVVLRTE